MRDKVPISVQIVHIQGPSAGTIQNFQEDMITIGRHPSAMVQFPPDLKIVSRRHAEIIREGNRFKVIDHSTNGTFLNGKPVEKAYLKNGDVLTFADGGPKVSFLVQVVTKASAPPEGAPAGAEPRAVPPKPERFEPQKPEPPVPPQPVVTPEPRPTPEPSSPVEIQKVKMPLVIQYGPSLRSYKELPVTLGRHPQCDFVLDHPDVSDRHVQFFHAMDQYWVKDLTGQERALVNGSPVGVQAPLAPEDVLSLGPHGPTFRFLGAGRLAEIEQTTQDKADAAVAPASQQPDQTTDNAHGGKSFFKKFLNR